MQVQMEAKSSVFLAEHSVATVSTVGPDGKVHGAAVYYIALGEHDIYFVSKTRTTKILNIEQHPQVAFTVVDAPKAQTLQISGHASEEADENTRQLVFTSIVKPHPYSGEMLMPPVTALVGGEYIVIHIKPEEVRFSDYRQEILDKRTGVA